MGMQTSSSAREESTHYEGDILRKMTNGSYLENSLDPGSKKRLARYRRNLSVSQGVNRPLFDDKLFDVIKEYAYDVKHLEQVREYLNNLTDPEGYKFSRNLKIYSKTEEAMVRFSANDHTSFRWNRNYQKSLKSLIDEVSSARLRPERYDNDDDILRALPKTNTHSGYYYIQSGKKEKGDNMVGICDQLKARKAIIRQDLPYPKNPILIAFRTQASGEFEDDGAETGTCKHKTRVVSMYDLRDVVLELQFSNPFQKFINQKEFYAGGKSEMQISAIIHNWGVHFRKFLSIDYSSYDQTISSWLIEDAFKVIEASFILTDGQRKELAQVCDNFIHKDFILNEGVLHSDKGVPSGSMFTQIIDSIVNVLVVRTYFFSINERCQMIAMGDDNAIFCSAAVSLEDLSSYLIKNFGLIVKTDDKSNEGLTSKQDVKFLSRYWTQGGPWRHPNQLVSRMLFPERFRNYNDEVTPYLVLYAYILTYPRGMRELVDVGRFMIEHSVSAREVEKVDSRYLPGSLAYIREYTGVG